MPKTGINNRASIFRRITSELVDNTLAALGERNAALLPNHGVVGIGRTIRDAFTVCELAEKTAKVYVCALTLGKVNPLPTKAVEVEKAFFTMLQSGNE